MGKSSVLWAVCAVSLLLCSCSKDSDKPTGLEPTITNLAGTWQADTYKDGGATLAKALYMYDYIQIGADYKFTARFGMIDALKTSGNYCYGTGTVEGRKVSLMASNITIPAEVIELTENKLTVKSEEGILQTFVRVAAPTLFQVGNKASGGASVFLLTAPFAANGTSLYLNSHGFFRAGEVSDQLTYTTFPKGMHLVLNYLDIDGNEQLRMTIYPQPITAGSADNVVALADTTMITGNLLVDTGMDMTKVDLTAVSAAHSSEAIPYSELVKSIGK